MAVMVWFDGSSIDFSDPPHLRRAPADDVKIDDSLFVVDEGKQRTYAEISAQGSPFIGS